MLKMSKFGLLTTTTLLSLSLLTACSSKEDETLPEVSVGAAPSIGSGTTTTTPSPEVPQGDPVGDMSLGAEDETPEGEEDTDAGDESTEEETLSPEEVEQDNQPATPPDGEETTGSPATLTSTNLTLDSQGATYNLTVTGGNNVTDVSYKIDKESVATIDNKGKVTAVANGTANVTVSYKNDGTAETLKATVKVAIPEEEPEATPEPEIAPEPEATPEPEIAPEPEVAPAPEAAPEPAPEAPSTSAKSVSGFYKNIITLHEFGMMDAVVGEFLANFYPGMDKVSTLQQEIHIAMMSATAVEIAVIEAADSSAVAAAKAVFNTRIQSQIDGGAFYPETIEAWKNNSRVVSSGNYVMMVVHPDCDAIVSVFNNVF